MAFWGEEASDRIQKIRWEESQYNREKFFDEVKELSDRQGESSRRASARPRKLRVVLLYQFIAY